MQLPKLPLHASLTAAILVFALAPAAHAQAAWKNVKISAGSGFVTGIVAQPTVPRLFYLRTDVGGFYRSNRTDTEWIPISDFLPIQLRADYGGEGIAVDPNNPNTVYIACGGGQPGAIFKSTNRGGTWKELGLTGVVMSGNDNMRWGGERLVVQPGNSNVILFGSREQGLWRTDDAGAHWKQTSLPYPNGGRGGGVQAVAFDPASPSTVYAAVARDGVFESTDSGVTWTNISTSITTPERITVGPGGALWATYNNGVSKFAQGTWTNCTPRGASADAYCGVAVNPDDARNVIVSYGLWGDTAPNAMFETTNAGSSWTRLNLTVLTDVPWYHAMDPGKQPDSILPFLYTPISNIVFDPNNPRSVWFTSAGGIYHTSDIDRSGGPIFHHMENGHEELCVTALASPPTGPELIAGVGDVKGFVFDRGLDAYPSRVFDESGANVGVTVGLAYQEADPKNMVSLGAAQSPWAYPAVVTRSTDGGKVWHQDKSFPTAAADGGTLVPIAIAMSADDPASVTVCVRNTGDNNDEWYFTEPGMSGWQQCAGLPDQSYGQLSAVPVAADPIAGKTFYAYVAGAVYRSTNGGRRFERMSGTTIGTPDEAEFFKLVAQPGRTGDLWLSEDADNANYLSPTRPAWEGLYHSTDAGRTWTKLPNVTRAVVFAFGKPSSSGMDTLFLYGRLNGSDTDRIYRSTNLGRTWVDIQHPGQAIGDGPWLMEGSWQTYGRVFIGTSGRGIFYSW